MAGSAERVAGRNSPTHPYGLGGFLERRGYRPASKTVIGKSPLVAAQFAVLSAFGLRVGVVENIDLALIFTFVSLIRGYQLRRLFDRLSS